MEVAYTYEDAHRDQRAVIDSLYRADWIQKCCESDGTLIIQWTEKGKTAINQLNDFYERAGVTELNGRQSAFLGLTTYVCSKAGFDDDSISLIDDVDLSRKAQTSSQL
jgi:hypothetical protein